MSKKNVAFFSFLLLSLLCSRDALIFLFSPFAHLYGVVNVDRLTFEAIYCYLPMVHQFSFASLLHFDQITLLQLSRLISLILEKILFVRVCHSNIDAYFFLTNNFFPLISFWVIFQIYKRYVSTAWALLLAFLGISFFSNFSMTDYFFQVFFRHGNMITKASFSPLEISRTPIPSLTFLIFILCFYWSTSTYKISIKRSMFLSALWALNAYVYLFNFIAGMIFWCGFIVFVQYIRKRFFKGRFMAKLLILNVFVIGVVLAPLILKMQSASGGIDRHFYQSLGILYRDAGLIFPQWGIAVGYFFPILITLLAIRIYCADYYELFYKFMPIFILICTEVIVLNLHFIFGSFFPTRLFLIRIGNFFLPYLYFIPALYFFSMPIKRLFHNTTRSAIAEKIHWGVDRYVIRFRIIISAIGIILMSLFVLFSNLRYFVHYRKQVAPIMNQVQARYSELIAYAGGVDGIAVSEDLPVNLLLSALGRKESLLPNSFNTEMKKEEIIDRLILYARIFNWPKERFLNFMLPNHVYKFFYSKNDFIVSESVFKNGFGYWLTWHLREMAAGELEGYRLSILKRFETMNLNESMKKKHITIVQSLGGTIISFPGRQIKADQSTKIYQVS